MSDCPSQDELEYYHAAELPQEQAERVRAHLADCPECTIRSATHVSAERKLLDELHEIDPAEIATPYKPAPSPVDRRDGELRSARPAIEGYMIVEELHRGGQGVVYRAIQEHAKREVAIKVLLEGPYASPAAKRRFEREIELAAQLKHPNIVTVFHSGLTPDGRQYCVMDYVHGRRLDQHVRERGLALEDTLALFATIRDAVTYAHQRGIIHRDLKPSNIIVDQAGAPKVLDFGLAKQMFGPADTFASLSGQVFGTLPYMSPEQTSGHPEEIDTRSDVYSLGVILYQLLTGRFPYPVDDRIPEVIRHITETPPTPPSRLWTSARGIAKRSTRQATPPKCPIDEDVQTIVLKALAKEPGRRYQSARELAADLRHYLAGEPIAARRASHWYVLQKTVRRYKARFAGAAVMVLLAIGSTIALSIMYGKQTRLLGEVEDERNRAVLAERTASDEKEHALAAEARARHRFDQVRELARTFIFDFHDLIENLRGATPARELLVKTALQYLDGLAAEAADDLSLLRELAVAYRKVAAVQGRPGAANLGDTAGAAKSYAKAMRLFERLAEADPQNVEARCEFADCSDALGTLQATAKQTAEALTSYQRAFQIYENLAEADPGSIRFQRGLARGHIKLGDVHMAMGRSAAALAGYERALEIRQTVTTALPDDPVVQRELSISFSRLGKAQQATGDREAALSSYRQSLEVSEARAAAEPDNAQAQRDLAEDLNNVGDALRNMGRFDEALPLYERGLRVREDLARVDPANTEAKRDLALGHNRLGSVYRLMDKLPEAEAGYRKGLEIVQAWAAASPDDVRPRKALRVFHTTIGYCQGAADHWSDALVSYQKALEIAEALAAADAESARSQRDLSVALYRLGEAQRMTDQLPEALATYGKCLSIREKLTQADPANVMYQRNVAEACYASGTAHAALGGNEHRSKNERLAHWREARECFKRAHNIHIAMREAGTLLTYDADMPEEGAKRLAECDAAIAESW